MIILLDDYDWKEAFGYAGEPGTSGGADIREAVPNSGVSLAPFTREDVAEIIRYTVGENDGPPWRMLGKLQDGRFFYLEAGCDYTGWDCRAGGCATVAKTIDEAIRFGMTDEAREAMGVTL